MLAKKKLLLVAVSLIVILVVTALALRQISRSRTFQLFGVLIPRVETSKKVVALTFDDGPTPPATDQILAILAEKNIKATFFVTGAELEQNLEQGKKIVNAGHELGNH